MKLGRFGVIFLAAMFALSAFAQTPVTLPLQSMFGQPFSGQLRVTANQPTYTDGTNVYFGTSYQQNLTSVYSVTIPMQPNNYWVQAGTSPQGFGFFLPSGLGTNPVSVLSLITTNLWQFTNSFNGIFATNGSLPGQVLAVNPSSVRGYWWTNFSVGLPAGLLTNTAPISSPYGFTLGTDGPQGGGAGDLYVGDADDRGRILMSDPSGNKTAVISGTDGSSYLFTGNGNGLTNIPLASVNGALATNGNGSGLTGLTAAQVTLVTNEVLLASRPGIIYSNFTSAASNAIPGDIVTVYPGTYVETNCVYLTNNVKIYGIGWPVLLFTNGGSSTAYANSNSIFITVQNNDYLSGLVLTAGCQSNLFSALIGSYTNQPSFTNVLMENCRMFPVADGAYFSSKNQGTMTFNNVYANGDWDDWTIASTANSASKMILNNCQGISTNILLTPLTARRCVQTPGGCVELYNSTFIVSGATSVNACVSLTGNLAPSIIMNCGFQFSGPGQCFNDPSLLGTLSQLTVGGCYWLNGKGQQITESPGGNGFAGALSIGGLQIPSYDPTLAGYGAGFGDFVIGDFGDYGAVEIRNTNNTIGASFTNMVIMPSGYQGLYSSQNPSQLPGVLIPNLFDLHGQYPNSTNTAQLNGNVPLSASKFTGSGSGLTSLPASQLTGTVPLANLPAAVVTNGPSMVIMSGTTNGDFEVVAQNASTGTNASTSFYAVANNGSYGINGSNNVQMGINGGNYRQNSVYFGTTNDGYVFVTANTNGTSPSATGGGNLWLGTYNTNTAIILSVGGAGGTTNAILTTNGLTLNTGVFAGNGGGLTNLNSTNLAGVFTVNAIGTATASQAGIGSESIQNAGGFPGLLINNTSSSAAGQFVRFQRNGANWFGFGVDSAGTGYTNFWMYDYIQSYNILCYTNKSIVIGGSAQAASASTLGIAGNLAIGSNLFQSAAPSNGLLVQGSVSATNYLANGGFVVHSNAFSVFNLTNGLTLFDNIIGSSNGTPVNVQYLGSGTAPVITYLGAAQGGIIP